MPYVYHTVFDMDPSQMSQLEVGAEIEIIAATLRSIMPGDHGHIHSRTMYSLDRPDRVHVIFESLWEDWDDLVAHREGEHDEYTYVTRWAPQTVTGPVTTHVYGEVGI